MDGGLVLVKYKRMAVQQKNGGLVVLDQFVAGCRENPRSLAILLKTQGSVHRDEGGQLRALSSETHTPPKEVPQTDKGATELGVKVCDTTKL